MGSFDLTFIETAEDTANTRGIAITASSTINTKGAYTELIASTASAAVMLRLTIIPQSTNITECLIDISTGAAASEVVLISNIKYYSDAGTIQDIVNHIDILVPIASGARLSARVQASVSSNAIEIIPTIYSGTFTFDSFAATTFGADTSNSRGSLIPDPGGSADTLGAYTEITSSLPHDVTSLVLSFGGNANTAFGTDFDWSYQIGEGAAASEVVVHSGTFVAGNSQEVLYPVLVTVPVVSSSGSRLAIRCQCNNTNATDRLLDVSVIGFNSSVTAAGGGGGGIATIVGGGGIVGG